MRNCVFSLLVLMGASFSLADDSPEAVQANDRRSEIVEAKREPTRQARRRFTMAQPRGLTLSEPGAYEGELLFAPLNGTSSYAVDAEGKVLRSWDSERQPGMSVYADEDGYIVRAAKVNPATGSPFERAGGPGGLLERYSPSGERVWRFGYHDDEGHLHHDFTLMPNGNVLAIAWAKVSSEEALAKGRRPEGVFGKWLYYTRLVEIEPSYPEGGEIVWVWNAWDYLVQDSDPAKPGYGAVVDNAHLIDINYYRSPLRSSNAPAGEVQSGAKRKTSRIGEVDWMHANSVDYDPGTGLILVSIHGFDEVWVIDKHAPEKGLVARFGNPRAHGAGGEADQIFFRQHDANWIDEGLPGEGNILLFNNGLPTKDNESA
ncbi:MAG: aryl-sulfate sulfotransferase [Verrucomicrobiota bacterium]